MLTYKKYFFSFPIEDDQQKSSILFTLPIYRFNWLGINSKKKENNKKDYRKEIFLHQVMNKSSRNQ